MKRMSIISVVTVSITCVFVSASSTPEDAYSTGSPIYGVTIPQGYRRWELIAVSQETGNLDELRAILGNSAAMKAYREGTRPFPDGTIIAKVAWKRVPSVGDDGALGRKQAFVPGTATTVQFMVKDSKKYSATGG